MLKKLSLAGIAALGFVLSSTAVAGDYYVGGSGGKSTLSLDNTTFNEGATAYKFFGGYAFGDYMALEATYLSGGNPIKDLPNGDTQAVSMKGYMGSLLLRARSGGALALFGKLSYAMVKLDRTDTIAGVATTTNQSERDLSYGLGAMYTIKKRYLLRAEYEVVNVKNAGFNAITLGAGIRF